MADLYVNKIFTSCKEDNKYQRVLIRSIRNFDNSTILRASQKFHRKTGVLIDVFLVSP